MKVMSLDDTVICVTSITSTAASEQTTSATHSFRRHITRARALPLEVITHGATKDATIALPRPAHIGGEDSVMTGLGTAGRKVSATGLTVTMSITKSVTYLTVTARTTLTMSVTSTHPSCMTAVHADCLMVYTLQVHVTITPKTARTNCSSPVMANATKIGLQYERRPIAVPCWEKLFTMEAMICVIFRPGHVHRDIMSTVSAMYTGQQSITLLRAKTLADTIRMADAIITQATVRTVIIRLTVNAIVKPAGIPAQHALKLVDITISRPHQQALMEPAIITVSTVMGSLLISSTA